MEVYGITTNSECFQNTLKMYIFNQNITWQEVDKDMFACSNSINKRLCWGGVPSFYNQHSKDFTSPIL